MTTEEKLSNIYSMAMADAKSDGQKALDAFRTGLDKAVNEHKELKNREAADAVRDEKLAIQKELNKEYSLKMAELRQAAARKQEEMTDKLFALVEERLQAVKGTPEYEDFLVRKIREVRDYAGGDSFTIEIDSSDESRLSSLAEITGAEITASEEKLGGGIRGVIPSRRVLIDNSFSALLAEEKAGCRFDGEEILLRRQSSDTQ